MIKSIDEHYSIALKPIVRHKNDISDYNNSSIDLSLRRKIGKGWHLQGLTRYWFIPDNTDRFFLWFDIGYSKPVGKSKLSTALRYHHAFDIKDRIDPDFVRLNTTWSFPSMGKITPIFSIEPFLRVDTLGKVTRMRYEPGIKWKITDKVVFTGKYRIEKNTNPSRNLNVAVVNLGITL